MCVRVCVRVRVRVHVARYELLVSLSLCVCVCVCVSVCVRAHTRTRTVYVTNNACAKRKLEIQTFSPNLYPRFIHGIPPHCTYPSIQISIKFRVYFRTRKPRKRPVKEEHEFSRQPAKFPPWQQSPLHTFFYGPIHFCIGAWQ